MVFGDPVATLALLGQSTAYIERTHLTIRRFNGRLTRKTLAFSKEVGMYRASIVWEDLICNLARPLKIPHIEVFDDLRGKWMR